MIKNTLLKNTNKKIIHRTTTNQFRDIPAAHSRRKSHEPHQKILWVSNFDISPKTKVDKHLVHCTNHVLHDIHCYSLPSLNHEHSPSSLNCSFVKEKSEAIVFHPSHRPQEIVTACSPHLINTLSPSPINSHSSSHRKEPSSISVYIGYISLCAKDHKKSPYVNSSAALPF